jgi:surface antigen
MAAVVAIFGVFALPAYAMDPSAASSDASDDAVAAAQALAVDDEALLATSTRDGYAATSYAEYLEEQAAVLRSSYGLSVAAEGDDYPFRGQYGLSALGYYMGQCTDFVAWRLNRDAGSVGAPWKYTWSMMTPSGGDAEQWLSAWQSHGWPVSTTPMAGAVAWFGGNHVGYVKEVYADGSFMVEDYNRVGYETYAREIFAPGSIPYFLYPPG